MTATETDTISTDAWTAEMAQLRSRYRAVREPILAALNLLMQDPNITDADAKARATMRGVRITAASINGARNLLAKRETAVVAPAGDDASARPAATTVRRVRPAPAEIDAEGLIRQVVGKLQLQGTAEAERLREAMRKAIATLQAAVG
jgi:hypothetical protein